MGLFSSISNLFTYQQPAPLDGEKLRRFELMGKSNKELNEILNRRPPLHIKKTDLVDMIIEHEAHQDNP